MVPRSPSFKIKVLHLALLNKFKARGLITESWSPRENLASRSLGVMMSKPWKSRMLPHRLAT